jgi:cellulose biosynthesis protein BcsQ
MTATHPADARGTIITFYSFKGGVGRTMALLNCAVILAKRGRRVLAIDLDLEAPGISYLARDKEIRPSEVGFVDLLLHHFNNPRHSPLLADKPLLGYLRRFFPEEPKTKEERGCVDILPSGNLTDLAGYQQRLHELNLRERYEKGVGKPVLKFFKEDVLLRTDYDYILIDSRTGWSDEATIAIRDLADHLVLLFALNHQNVEGTATVLRSLAKSRAENGEGPRTVTCVASPIPMGEHELFARRIGEAERAINEAWPQPGESKSLLKVFLPYTPNLALDEQLHLVLRKGHPLTEAYNKLATELQHLTHDTPDRFVEQLQASLESENVVQALASLKELADFGSLEAKLYLSRWLAGLAEARIDSLHGALLRNFARERRFDTVIPLLQESLPVSVHRSQTYEQLCHLHLLNDDLPSAEKEMRQAVKHFPGEARLHRALGDLLWQHLDKPEEALTCYQQEIDLLPDMPNGHRALAAFYWRNKRIEGHLELAEKAFERAWECDGSAYYVHLFRSYADFLWQEKSDFATAEKRYKTALLQARRPQPHPPNRVSTRLHHAEMLMALEPSNDARRAILQGRNPYDVAEDEFERGWKYYRSIRAWAKALLLIGAGLLQRLRGRDDALILGRLKFLIKEGFVHERYSTSGFFSRKMGELEPDDKTLYVTLVEVLRGLKPCAVLEHDPRWRTIEKQDSLPGPLFPSQT